MEKTVVSMLKQKELEETLKAIQIDITHTKDTLSDQTQTLTDIAKTQELHGEEINKHETDLSGIITRLNAIEALVNQAPGENNPRHFAPFPASKNFPAIDHHDI